MKHLTTIIRFSLIVFMVSACSKNSDTDSTNLIGDWKVVRSTTIVANGKHVDSYNFNFSLKINDDGTCYRTQPVGTDTLFWALQLKQNILVIASRNPTANLSGYRLNILKNEPNGHKWDDHIFTSYLMDTVWVNAVFTDVYDVTPK